MQFPPVKCWDLHIQNGESHCTCPFLSAILAVDEHTGGGQRRARTTSFLLVLTGPSGDTQRGFPRQDQLETRAWKHQTPTISSGCRLLYSTARTPRWGNGQESQQARGTARGRGAEAIFMLLSDTEVSWRLKHMKAVRDVAALQPAEWGTAGKCPEK